MNDKIIISISGKKRTGKDTLAEAMKDNLIKYQGLSENEVEIIGFADGIKEVVSILLQVPGSEIMSAEFKLNFFRFLDGESVVGRDILKKLGKGIADILNPTVWINIVDQKISKSKAKVIIVKDVRLRDEYEYLKYIGAYKIRLNRTDLPDIDTHFTETDLDKETGFDSIINHGKLYDVESTFKDLALSLLDKILY